MTDARPTTRSNLERLFRREEAPAPNVPGTRPDLADGAPSDDEVLSALATLLPPVDPPESLLDSIEARIGELPCEPIDTLRAEEGEWVKLADNVVKKVLFGGKVWMKILYGDDRTGESVYLLRCEPGAVIPAHKHARDEHAFVIEGEYVVGNTVVKAGDYQFSPAGSRHGKITSPTGCLALIHA